MNSPTSEYPLKDEISSVMTDWVHVILFWRLHARMLIKFFQEHENLPIRFSYTHQTCLVGAHLNMQEWFWFSRFNLHLIIRCNYKPWCLSETGWGSPQQFWYTDKVTCPWPGYNGKHQGPWKKSAVEPHGGILEGKTLQLPTPAQHWTAEVWQPGSYGCSYSLHYHSSKQWR